MERRSPAILLSRLVTLVVLATLWPDRHSLVDAQLNSFGLGQFGGQQFGGGGGFGGGNAGSYGGFGGGGDFSQFQGASANGPSFNLNSLTGYGVPPGVNFGSSASGAGFSGEQGNFAQGGFGAEQGFTPGVGAHGSFPQGFSNQGGQLGQDVLGQQGGHQVGQPGLDHGQLGAAGQFGQDQTGLQSPVNQPNHLEQGAHGPQLGLSGPQSHGSVPTPGLDQQIHRHRQQGAAVLGQPGQPVLSPGQQRNVPLPGHIGGAGHLAEQHNQQIQHLPQHGQQSQQQQQQHHAGNSGHSTHAAQHLAPQSHDPQGGHHPGGAPGSHHGLHQAHHGESPNAHLQGGAHLQNHHQRTDGGDQYNSVNYNGASQYPEQYEGQQLGLQVPPEYQQQALGQTSGQHKDEGKGGHGVAAASSHTKFEGIPLEAFVQHREEQFGRRVPHAADDNQRDANPTTQLGDAADQQHQYTQPANKHHEKSRKS